ncbi:ABC transporter permease subunit [Micromonospora robiginosa]|uniref:ABC transporter permease subunit n=1 Tax=Micromonospora robiginosa TaxID=2749844 RepID=A0A7L6B3N9_9ACTN|nr:ABC transporter permease subunit [Micromonospora ferruginea]QLQ36556.1 ABC transporter permease subunit [Micromonospora ferruginea]
MLRFELTTQLLRIRTLIALACLAGVPVAAALPFASQPGERNGNESGLFGASPYSAANHAMASLEFTAPLLLPIVVALLSCAIASADRDWGVLRYLYAAPVTRERLLAAKLAAAALATLVAVAVVMAAGLAAGTVFFGWHPFHIIGASALTVGDATIRVLAATGYTLLCMLAMAAIAFTLGLVLPRGAEALAVAVGFVVLASIINGQPALPAVAAVLPVHYWQDWVGLFDPAGVTDLALGVVVQLAAIVVCTVTGWLVLRHRDPAA